MSRRVSGLLLVCGLVPSTIAVAAEPAQITELQKGMPATVAGLIARIVYCNHWSGEEPYDADRAKQIQNAVSELKCDSLSADEAVALKKYGQEPGVRRAITKAGDVYL